MLLVIMAVVEVILNRVVFHILDEPNEYIFYIWSSFYILKRCNMLVTKTLRFNPSLSLHQGFEFTKCI